MQAKWGKDPKMSPYLRPLTLFGTKFEAYLNQVETKSIKEQILEANKRAAMEFVNG